MGWGQAAPRHTQRGTARTHNALTLPPPPHHSTTTTAPPATQQLFYHDLWHELLPLRPFWKIACIKLLVMATFWQGIGISLLADEGQIRGTATYTLSELQNSLQDFIICLEMAAFAVAHHYVMDAGDFAPGSPVLEFAFALGGGGGAQARAGVRLAGPAHAIAAVVGLGRRAHGGGALTVGVLARAAPKAEAPYRG